MLGTAFALTLLLSPGSAPTAQELVQRGLEAMGGKRVLAIAQTKVSIVGHSYAVEQSERPTGPYIATYEKTEETIDFAAQSVEVDQESNGLLYGGKPFKGKTKTSLKVSALSTNPVALVSTARRLALGPERIFATAAQSSDLSVGKPFTYQGVPHLPLDFHWGKIPVRIFLNANTYLPSAVETVEQMPGFHAIWGDSTTHLDWCNWQLSPNGTLFPTQWVQAVNGIVEVDLTVLDYSQTEGSAAMQIASYPALPPTDSRRILNAYKKVELAPGVFQYAGPYNTGVIDQGDGLVILEPVINSGFADAFLEKVAVDFPGKKIKAVVASSDAWPHLGGVRSYIARGIPIVTCHLNQPILSRLANSAYKTNPDSLEKARRSPIFRLVKDRLELGKGTNRILFVPIAGEGSERMSMVYLPEIRMLYGSDLLQPMPDGTFFFPAYPLELTQAVEREKFDVKTVFGMHCPPTPWTKVVDYIRGFRPPGKS